MSQRTCSKPDCHKPHRARGYCTTHYNRLVLSEEQRHPKRSVTCVVCSASVLRRSDPRYQPTCSVRCRTVVQWGQTIAPISTYDWALDAVKRATEHGAAIVDRFDRTAVFDRDAWTCWVCTIRCTDPDPYSLTAATVDHLVPLSRGGEHSLANARTCCLSCNSRRQADLPAAQRVS